MIEKEFKQLWENNSEGCTKSDVDIALHAMNRAKWRGCLLYNTGRGAHVEQDSSMPPGGLMVSRAAIIANIIADTHNQFSMFWYVKNSSLQEEFFVNGGIPEENMFEFQNDWYLEINS